MLVFSVGGLGESTAFSECATRATFLNVKAELRYASSIIRNYKLEYVDVHETGYV